MKSDCEENRIIDIEYKIPSTEKPTKKKRELILKNYFGRLFLKNPIY